MDNDDDLHWYDDVEILGGVDLTLWVKLMLALAALIGLAGVGLHVL